MTKPWETENCAAMKAHYAAYSIPQAAALWCGIPESLLPEILAETKQISPTGLGRSIYVHPYVSCIEPRCRAIAEALEEGALPYGREDARPVASGDHVAHDRRRFFGRDLKAWMEKAFPNEKPAFLFDDIERSTHTAISADAYRSLIAERDTLKNRLNNAKAEFIKLRLEKETIESDRNSLKVIASGLGSPGDRAESTYLNIIAALLECIAGDIPGIDKHPSFASEAKLIEKIEHHFQGYNGLSKSNLSRKFPAAKKALKSR